MSSQTRFYRHYKNKPYKFLGIARHSETLEELALYETLYENELGKIWVRPKAMFFEDVTLEGQSRPRFEKIDFEFRKAESLPERDASALQVVYEAAFGEQLDKEKFLSKLKCHSRLLFLSAFEGEKLVGFKLGYAQDDNLFYSWLGGVLPSYQNLGIAGELTRLQHEWCRSAGFKKIETRTRNKYREMIRLNLKSGFTIVGTQASSGKGVKIILEKELK
jgi:ribosomal protein S18 acetylase RimI-like enzyme